MKRHHQTLEEILSQLSPVETTWMDERAEATIAMLDSFQAKESYGPADLEPLFLSDFNTAYLLMRLFIDLPKDEFEQSFREALGGGSTGVTSFRSAPGVYLAALGELGLYDVVRDAVNTPVTWRSVLIERLKSGRGSAIKGQRRGKKLEDFVEQIVDDVFGEGNFEIRCRFVGATGLSTEKTDVAIPSKGAPRILIEAKAYGSTGSKQTDVLGDITRIVAEKRDDTVLFIVTDGVAWNARRNDLRKLIEMQRQGRIARIYTVKMHDDLVADLKQLKAEQGL